MLSVFGVEHELAKGLDRHQQTAAMAAQRKKGVNRATTIGKSAFGIVHKGALAAVDDVALAPGKVKAVTGTVRSGVAVPAPGTTPPKAPLTQKLNDAITATGGAQT